MTERTTKLTLPLLALLALTSCGGDETGQGPGGTTGDPCVGDFCVRYSDPQQDASGNIPMNVAVNKVVTITFNEAFKPETVMGNVTVGEEVSGSSNDFTSQVRISASTDKKTLSVTPSSAFRSPAKYIVTIGTGLQSVSGRYLAYVTDVIFCTGSCSGEGGISVPGPPHRVSRVRSIGSYYGNTSYCTVGMLVTFNEDVRSLIAQGRYCDSIEIPTTRCPSSWSPMKIVKNPSHQREYLFTFFNDGCNINPNAYGKIQVNITNGFDLSNETFSPMPQLCVDFGGWDFCENGWNDQ